MGDIRLIGIFGGLGCYKTALAVVLARDLCRSFGVGCVSNINLKFPNARKMEISELVGNEYVDTVLLEDEIYSLADSRCSMSEKNIFYTYSIAQARKSPHEAGGRGIGNFVIYTAQLQSMADVRLFDLTNLFIVVDKLPNGDCLVEWVTDGGNSGEFVK